MIMRYKWPFFALLLGLIAYAGYHLLQNNDMPNVLFTTIEGKTIKTSELKGKVVMVNFWATDCQSCVAEMPDIVQTYQTYKAKGLVVIAVAMPYDPPAQVLNYVQQKQLPFLVMHDGFGTITDQFGHIALTPTTFIYDRSGKQLKHIVGAINFTQLNALLQKVLS